MIVYDDHRNHHDSDDNVHKSLITDDDDDNVHMSLIIDDDVYMNLTIDDDNGR
jgi:hypothetical protein